MKLHKAILILGCSLGFQSAAFSAGLADTHITCATCHEEQTPKPGVFVENDKCLTCHGPLEQLQKKTSSFGKKNPHDNHLGEIECALCHKGHAKSQAYCLECHKDFVMPMK